MGLDSGLEPAVGIFAGGFANLASKAYWLIPVAIIIAIALGAWLWHKKRDKDNQWTHNLKIRRVLQSGLLSDTIVHRMRRFPLVKNAEVFELEKPVLGSYLLPELDEYTGHNEYSIIIDKNNRIYNNRGEKFNPDTGYVNVSARHAEIDIEHSDLKAKYQDINKISKRIDWATIAKYAMWTIFIIALTIVSIVGIQNWGEAQAYQAQAAQAEMKAMENLNSVLKNIEGTKNTDLIIIEKLKDLTGNQNIQSEIQNAKEV